MTDDFINGFSMSINRFNYCDEQISKINKLDNLIKLYPLLNSLIETELKPYEKESIQAKVKQKYLEILLKRVSEALSPKELDEIIQIVNTNVFNVSNKEISIVQKRVICQKEYIEILKFVDIVSSQNDLIYLINFYIPRYRELEAKARGMPIALNNISTLIKEKFSNFDININLFNISLFYSFSNEALKPITLDYRNKVYRNIKSIFPDLNIEITNTIIELELKQISEGISLLITGIRWSALHKLISTLPEHLNQSQSHILIFNESFQIFMDYVESEKEYKYGLPKIIKNDLISFKNHNKYSISTNSKFFQYNLNIIQDIMSKSYFLNELELVEEINLENGTDDCLDQLMENESHSVG